MSLSKSTCPEEESNTQNYISICGICLSTYEVPKALPCLHSFCLACIREWASHVKIVAASGCKVVSCPNCRKDCVLPSAGVDGLPTNFFITERNQDDNPPVCNSCGNRDREIVARCRECGFVCHECLLPHKSMRTLMNHTVIILDALRVGKTGKRLALGIGVAEARAEGGRKPMCGTFKLEKTIDVRSIDNKYDGYCCAFTSASSSTFHVTVPTNSIVSTKVYVLDLDGNTKLVIDTKHGLSPGSPSIPWDITKSSDDIYYITDCNPWVKVHDKEGKFMRLFQLADVNGKRCTPGRAIGITIDQNGQIIVGDHSNTISIYKPDGSFVTGFNVDILPHYVATQHTDTDILIVSANGGKSVLEVDYSGKVLNTFTSPIAGMEWKTGGVCCSKMGEIFVVNQASGHCCVCRFTSTLQYTGCVISDLENPRGIAISEDGELIVVVDYPKLKIFRRS